MVKDCNCNWDTSFLETHEIVCDIHHIKKRSEGGDDSLSNLIATCPNSHRMLDRGLITTDRIINIEEYIRRNSPYILEEFFQTQV
jgi:predicted restriction endonuclease